MIVGHGPDRPNTPHIDGFYSGPPAAFAPYYAPSFRYRAPAVGARRAAESRSRSAQPRALCYAQVNTHTSASQPFVTDVPPSCSRTAGRFRLLIDFELISMKIRYAALGAVLAIAIAGTTAVPTPLAAQSKTVKPAAAED